MREGMGMEKSRRAGAAPPETVVAGGDVWGKTRVVGSTRQSGSSAQAQRTDSSRDDR